MLSLRSDPVADALELLHDFELEGRAEIAAGPFGEDAADWTTVQGLLFHEGLLPALSVARWPAGDGPLLVEREIEARAAEALGRRFARLSARGAPIPAFGRRLRLLGRALAGCVAGRPEAGARALALCQDSQEGAEAGEDAFWQAVLPRGTARLWTSVRAIGRAPRRGTRFEPFLLRALAGPMRAFGRRARPWLDREGHELASRLRVPGLPPSAALADAFHALLREGTMQSALSFYAAERALRALGPRRLCLYTEFAAPGYQFLRACRRAGVRTVAVQHGDLVEGLSSGLLAPRLDLGVVADTTCVFGRAYRDLLRGLRQYDGAELRVTGQCFRGFAPARPEPRPDGDVLVLSQSFLSAASRAAFFASIRQCRARDLRVKLHPYERRALDPSWLPDGARVVPGSTPIAAALEGARVVVGASSSALLEALACGFPVVTIEDEVERIRHADLRAQMQVVAAGSDPSEAIVAARPAPDLETLAAWFEPEPDPAAFASALEDRA